MSGDKWEGKWKQFKGAIKESFGKLTDDDLKVAEGGRDKLIGKIQERYGITKEEAEKRLNEQESSHSGSASNTNP